MDAVEEVKSRLSIEDVIGEYVVLKRAGRNFRGLSPFNSEKSPSFMVSPEKQIWHDFSSNKGGNVFSFVMEMEGLDFKATLELLAKKAGLDLEQYRPKNGHQRKGPNKERLYAALDAATKFYQVQLKANSEALNYALVVRGLTKQTILEWRLGYSPNNGQALRDYLVKLGFSPQEMSQAGLISQRSGRTNDMFRGRFMIPLADQQGQIIGFTARQLKADDYGPKYLNTPQTVLYDKSRHIFGLHHAKTSIREAGYVVAVEGNMDVISSFQAGIRQTVASAGTALTEAHLKILSRFTADIRLCFDADSAGIAATERVVNIASRLKISINIICFDDSKDPDELIQKDPALWRSAIEKYSYALDWLIERQSQMHDISSAEGKRHFTDAVLPVVAKLDDPVEKDHYLARIAKIANISRDALNDKTGRQTTLPQVKKTIQAILEKSPADVVEIAKCEDHLLCLVLNQPDLIVYLKEINPEMLSRPQASELLTALRNRPNIKEKELSKLPHLADYVKIVSLQYEELYQGLETAELSYEAARLSARLIEQYVKQQKQKLALLLVTANEAATEDLLKQARRLDQLLRTNLGEMHG